MPHYERSVRMGFAPWSGYFCGGGMVSEASGGSRRGTSSDADEAKRGADPHLFHGDEEYDESESDRVASRPPSEPPPTGEELAEEPGHIPSQEAWLGTTTSEEESLDRAAEEQATGGAADRAPKAVRDDDE